MSILFGAVAYEKKISAKFASCDGNFMEITVEMLQKLPPGNNKMTYSHGHYLFHYIAEDDYFYFCITAKTCQRSRAFLFLNEIQRRFKQSDKHDFYRVLAEEMYRYSEDYSTITIRKGELDELNTIGVGSSETILGEKMLFVNNPENLSFSTISYVEKVPQEVLVSKSYETNTKYFHYIMLSVILVTMWLAISCFGPTSFVIIACIFVLTIVRLHKVQNKSSE